MGRYTSAKFLYNEERKFLGALPPKPHYFEVMNIFQERLWGLEVVDLVNVM